MASLDDQVGQILERLINGVDFDARGEVGEDFHDPYRHIGIQRIKGTANAE
ncbi:MAG: hypothetical protein NVS3B14_17490 [Ktedonobacteraceae bacterium]